MATKLLVAAVALVVAAAVGEAVWSSVAGGEGGGDRAAEQAPASTARNRGSNSLLQASPQRLARELTDGPRDAPGAVVVLRHRGGQRIAAAGLARLFPPRPMRAGELFRLGHASEPFVAGVVLDLVEDRRLGLEDPVDLAGGATVRELLSHRTGIEDYRLLPDAPAAVEPRQALARALERPRHEPPYPSSTDYLALGLLVERLTGGSYGEALANRVTRPLTLTGIAFRPDPVDAEGLAAGHALSGSPLAQAGGAPVEVTAHGVGAWAGTGVAATAPAVARYVEALLNGDLLGRELTPALTGDPAELGGGHAFGLGVTRFPTPCGLAWGAGGRLPGYVVEVRADEDGGRVAVVAVNGESPATARNVANAADRLYCSG